MRVLLYGLVGVPLLAFVGVLAYAIYREVDHARQDALDSASRLSARTAAQTERFLADAQAVLREIAGQPHVRALDSRTCDPMLERLVNLKPIFANVVTLDINGRLVCSARSTERRGESPHSKAMVEQVAAARGFAVGKPARGFAEDKWMVVLAYPLTNDRGGVVGAVAAEVDLIAYRPLVALDDVPSDALLWILHQDGTVVARSEDPEQWVGTQPHSDAARFAREGTTGTARARNVKGVERFIARTPIGKSGWVAVAGIDTAAVMQRLQRDALRWLALGGAGAVVVLLLTAFVKRRIELPLERIAATVESVAHGALGKRVVAGGARELQAIARALNVMLDVRQKAEATLATANERLHQLSRSVLEVQEQERRDLARELHDRAGQSLTALNLNLSIVQAQLAGTAPADVRTRLSDCQQLLEGTTRQLRDVMCSLRPPELAELGLFPALRDHGTQAARRASLEFEITGADPVPRLDEKMEIAAFRIAQEALNNAIKHAFATRLSVSLEQHGSEVVMTVVDDGRGLDTTQSGKTLGITTMRERAESMGACLQVEAAYGRGTRITLSMPHPRGKGSTDV